ncbi:MAG: siphovirus ReqiPepy6 Gp37-like family protein [Lachnospiraceae bacterium]|nr:siphovirus ReqiPepy6 Gp37-like family protein [Lachnospiraceae bacterium]
MRNFIEIINQDFELLGLISDFESLIYTRNFYESGNFELTISRNKANTNKLVRGNMLILNKKENKILLIDRVVSSTQLNGHKTLKITGDCVKGLTKRRIIATNGYDRIAQTQAENIQKHYIQKHIVESYYDTTRTPERDIAWIEVAPSQNRGISTTWQARLTNLHDELKHISEDTGLGWQGLLDRTNKKIVFDSIEGHDRTIHQNADGNTHEELSQYTHEQLGAYTHAQLRGTPELPFIIFSEKKKNLIEGVVTDDETNYKNVGYIAGKGENEDRLIVVLGNSTGFDRKEVLVDLNNIDDPDELNQEGQKKLDTYKLIQSVEGRVYQIPNMIYEEDWDLGDLVTLESDGVYEDKKIIQVKEVYERNNITIEVGFGDKIPTLAEQIKSMTDKPIL